MQVHGRGILAGDCMAPPSLGYGKLPITSGNQKIAESHRRGSNALAVLRPSMVSSAVGHVNVLANCTETSSLDCLPVCHLLTSSNIGPIACQRSLVLQRITESMDMGQSMHTQSCSHYLGS